MKCYLISFFCVSCLFITGCDQKSPMSGGEPTVQTKSLSTEEQFAELVSKAEKGDMQSSLDVYVHYALSSNTTDLEQEKIWLKVLSDNTAWLTEKASLGDKQAQFALGMILLKSGASDLEKQKSLTWFTKSAAQGFSKAQYAIGALHLNGTYGVTKDTKKGVEWITKAANSGLLYAQVRLGDVYYQGVIVQKDLPQAVIWYSKAAEQGHAVSQRVLGGLYHNGEGVPQDYAKAFSWYQRLAAKGDPLGQVLVGGAYLYGHGVPQNIVHAYAWANLAATDGSSFTKEIRDDIESRLTSLQLEEGQRLASNWKLGDLWLGDGGGHPALVGGAVSKQGTGTAFLVSKSGHALTNRHVVNGCLDLRLAGRTEEIKVITTDEVNDLALLEISGTFSEVAKLNSDPSRLRQGADVVVFGYPLNSVLSSGGNLTPGTVSALTGLGNNTNQIQITAPIQPGSSGSPVLDRKGYVVGIVSMKLDDIKAARATGSIPQNVNFAVNEQTIIGFLNANKIEYRTGGGLLSFEKNNADIAEDISKSTLLVECWK